jgi:AcrR family transcriptional regulator
MPRLRLTDKILEVGAIVMKARRKSAKKLPATPARRSRRDAILNEASHELNRRGVSLETLRRIAQKLGITREALYYYFKDRNDLVSHCYLETAQTLNLHLDEVLATSSTQTERIHRFIDDVLADDALELCGPINLGMMDEVRRRMVVQAIDELFEKLAGLLKRGIDLGEFRACETGVAAPAIVSLILWQPFVNLVPSGGPKAPRQAYREFIKSLILKGTAADRSAMPPYEEIEFKAPEGSAAQAFDRIWITDVKRAAILSTASRLFNEKGVDTTTLDEIASQFGATTGALYHHIGDKETLVTQCYLRAYQLSLFIIDRALEQPGSRLGAIAAYEQAWTQAQMRKDVAPMSQLASFDALSASSKGQIQNMSQQFGARWRKLTGDALAAGEYRKIDLDILQRTLPGLSNWLVRMETGDLENQRSIGRELGVFLTLGIGALPGATADLRPPTPLLARPGD